MEGWLLQTAAFNTAESPGESNAFLYQMFAHGYDAWAAERQARDEALMRNMGWDVERLRGMSLDELDSWMESQTFDSDKENVLEAFFRENPHLREESVANLEAMQRNAKELLERDDSRFLYVPVEEVLPWIALFNERISQSDFSGASEAAMSEETVRDVFKNLALPLMREMAVSIFTRSRIHRLIAELKKYRNERFAAGDRVTAEQAMGAINDLQGEDNPGANTFLLTLCWRSLVSADKAGAAGVNTWFKSRLGRLLASRQFVIL
jgi:hypothetical protein